MRLTRWGLASGQHRGGLGGPGDREGDEAEEQIELARGDEAGVLEVEAAGLGVAEETFDGPTLTVGREGGAGRGVGGDDEEFAALEASRREVQPKRTGGIAASQRGAERVDAAAFSQPRAQREAAAVLGGDDHLLLHADREGKVVFLEEIHPFEPDELPVRKQQPDACRPEDRQVAPHQRDPLAAVAGAAVVVEHAPDQWHARPSGDHGQHQDVDVARPALPLRAVEREMPRTVEPQEPDHQRRRPILSEPDMLEEPLQPAVGRGDQRRARPLAGQMAEIHRPGTDHTDDDQAQRLQTALAQVDPGTQNPGEGGDGKVRHRAILWRESSRKSPSTALSHPSVVQCGAHPVKRFHLLDRKHAFAPHEKRRSPLVH